MTTSPRWTIRADRRTLPRDVLRGELEELAETLTGLDLTVLPQADFDDAPDRGAFRDWAPVAVVTAADPRILDALAEELVLEFGFQVDVLKHDTLHLDTDES